MKVFKKIFSGDRKIGSNTNIWISKIEIEIITKLGTFIKFNNICIKMDNNCIGNNSIT